MENLKKTIWITGKTGQLAQCLGDAFSGTTDYRILFTGRTDINLLDDDAVENYMLTHKVDFVINTTAYTQVDAAEDHPEEAILGNTDIPMVLAHWCQKLGARLIHISTDYVFDGTAQEPYTEEDGMNPQTQYGLSKMLGEMEIQHAGKTGIIIRTSWLYSEYGHNFVKTMLRLGAEKESLRVVNDQHGSPTYARHLADAIVQIIKKLKNLPQNHPGDLYHFSNSGQCTWFDFATAIMNLKNLNCKVEPCSTADYPTKALRPAYSVLNCDKIQQTFDISIATWQDALRQCLQKIPNS
jgi:dTDP-4-dehydrorhamnose reductase